MTVKLTAITTDGREVILSQDGGWTYRDTGAYPQVSPTFRRTFWGMSREQVQQSEETELIKENDEGLIFKGRVSRYPCLIAYIFGQGKLVRAKYHLLAEHAAPNDYIADFEHVQGILTKKYGEAAEAETHWVDDRYRDDEDSWGKAVALGHLVLWATWQSDLTEVSLMLRGEEQRILLEIEYSSQDLQNLESDTDSHIDLDDF
jgi:hypothetical protein